MHGVVERAGADVLVFDGVPARRWRRWSARRELPPVELPLAVAHLGLRAPFAFPDGTVADWVLTPSGWARRRAR